MKTLVVLSSILGDRSNSRHLADHLIARTKANDPTGTITVRDLATHPVPYFDGDTVGALFSPAESRTPAQQDIVALQSFISKRDNAYSTAAKLVKKANNAASSTIRNIE